MCTRAVFASPERLRFVGTAGADFAGPELAHVPRDLLQRGEQHLDLALRRPRTTRKLQQLVERAIGAVEAAPVTDECRSALVALAEYLAIRDR